MIERSADDMDTASALTDQANEQAVLRRRNEEAARIRRTQIARNNGVFDGLHCIDPDCGEELPAARLADHRMKCTPCQSADDKRAKLGGGR